MYVLDWAGLNLGWEFNVSYKVVWFKLNRQILEIGKEIFVRKKKKKLGEIVIPNNLLCPFLCESQTRNPYRDRVGLCWVDLAWVSLNLVGLNLVWLDSAGLDLDGLDWFN